MEFGAGLGLNQEPAAAAFARQYDYFVNAAFGNDGNDGSPGSPLRTFQEAVNRADDSNNPGANNIFLAPGTYEGANINDNDLLKVYGQGAAGDVNIRDFGDVIKISGGSDVRLFNMQVDGLSNETLTGGHGIYANGLDYLFLNNVISRDNGGSGLYTESVTKVKLYFSTFEDNREFGAYLYDGYKVRSVGSDFSDNRDDGMQIEYYDRLEMIDSQAHNNGWFGDGGAIEIQSGGDGVEADDVDSIRFVGGSYNHNNRHGIDIDYASDVTLIAVEASYNDGRGDSRGVRARSIYESAVVDGGVFEYNGDDGVNIFGINEQMAAFGENTNGTVVDVFGGKFWNNGDDGVDVENVYRANLYGVDARFNEDDGAEIQRAEYGYVFGGYLFDNGQNGLELSNNYYSQVNDLVSKENYEDGLGMRGGNRLNVLGGVYSDNGDDGIRAQGDFGGLTEGGGQFSRIQRVDIKYATVMNNDDEGVEVDDAYLVKMVGGTYSENTNDGIELGQVTRGIFKDIVVLNNGEHGLEFQAGLFDDVQLGDSNWNHLKFEGGLYQNNAYDGIFISTNQNRGWNRNVIEVEAYGVVARDNGWNGFHVGRGLEPNVAVGEFEGESDLYLTMEGGYYGFNGNDGIRLLADVGAFVEGRPFFGGFVGAFLTDVVAEFNGDDGLRASSVLANFVDCDRLAEGNGGGNGDSMSAIQVTRGSYSFNGHDGINMDFFVFEEIFDDGDLLVGNGLPDLGFFTLAGLDYAVAVQNGYNGVSLDAFAGSFGNGIPSEGTNGEEEYAPLFHFDHGVFNQNGKNGIKINTEFDFVEEGVDFFDLTAARLEYVETSLNGRNGVLIRNFDPEFFRPDVELVAGIHNSNGKDGVHVRGFDELSMIDGTIIIGNDEDGLHSRDNNDTFISDDAIITGNGAQNVRIN